MDFPAHDFRRGGCRPENTQVSLMENCAAISTSASGAPTLGLWDRITHIAHNCCLTRPTQEQHARMLLSSTAKSLSTSNQELNVVRLDD